MNKIIQEIIASEIIPNSLEVSREPKLAVIRKDNLIRDSVRLLTLFEGSGALADNSMAHRLNNEITLFDLVPQPIESLKHKILSIGNSKYIEG